MSNKIFEDAGVLGDLSVQEYPLFFLPLEQDLLSLELEDSFGDLFLVSIPFGYSHGHRLIVRSARTQHASI